VPQNENALTAQDVADALQVSRNTVYNLVRSGELSSYTVGRKMRFTLDDLNDYIERSRGGKKQPRSDTVTRPDDGATLRLVGTDISADILANWLSQAGITVERDYEHSYQALISLYRGTSNAALVHIYDQRTQRFNIPYIQRLVPGIPVCTIHIAKRRCGLLVRKGNPQGLRRWRDLLREGVVIANQQPGSGERILLDEMMVALDAGLVRPEGYQRVYASPMNAALAVAQGDATVSIGNERTYHQVEGLDFLPLATESIDLVVRKSVHLNDVLHEIRRICSSRGFAEDIAGNVGYDPKGCGTIIYEL
jgi:putative molybdopterin biosynthesis protein